MSALPAEITELSQNPRPAVVPAGATRRAERRVALKEARRSSRRWTILSCCILGSSFGLTVGILDVLH
jgi:hypothetical protein